MTMKHVDLNVCVRTKDAICMYRFDTAARTAIRNDSMHPTGKAIQGDCNDCAVAFTESGSHGAFATTQEVVIQDMTTGAQIVLSEKNVTSMCFSPKGTFLVTFYLPGTEAVRNVAIWTAIDGQLITRFQQYVWPAVLWTPNEMYALRQTSNMVTLLKGDVQHPGVLGKIEITPVKGKDFVVALGNTSILLMLPSDSKARREGKIVGYSLPNLEQTVINMTLEELDDGEIKWSPSGDVAIVIARVDFDRSNQSYYGSSRIFLANFRKKKISRVQIKEGTPIHDVVWSSDVHNQEFLVVSGKMPDNDATIFDVHGKSVYHFNQQPRNTVRWSPQKRLFALGGSGSLNGVFQFYDREKIGQPDYQNGKLGSFTMKSLDYEWSPCGEYILTAVVYTRQRAGNKVCIWHYTGECMLDLPLENICEVRWVPNKSLELPDLQELKAAVAAPGAAPKTLFKPRHTSAGAAAILSRSKADVEGFAGSRKIDVKENGLPPGAVVIVNHVPKAKVKPAAKQLSPSITLEEGECPEKKLKTMMKKLRQIEELKGKDKSTLNSEQLDKLKKETQMRCDIAYLETLVSSKKN